MAWTELAHRRLVTSVMVMPFILKHRVRGLIMMMVMRQFMTCPLTHCNGLWNCMTLDGASPDIIPADVPDAAA
jgi:ABC-type sulfate transport system permease component